MAPEQTLLHELEAVLRDRLETRPPGSYTVTLLDDLELLQRKVVEEGFEFCLELARSGRPDFLAERVASEAADLIYHVLAGLVAVGVPLDAVLGELAARRRGPADPVAGAGDGDGQGGGSG